MKLGKLRSIGLSAGWCLALLGFLAGGAPAADLERWGMWEASLNGPREGNPYLDVELTYTLRHEGESATVRGFYDGDGIYRVRFSPPTPGTWRYETRSNRPELDGKSGSFIAGPPAAGNQGPIEVFQTFYLHYADGTPYHQYGTTCYAWVHQPRELQEQSLQTLAASPFNKIRFCVFPKSYYIANKNEPERFAFMKKADGKFDFSRPDPEFWRLFERRILDLQKLGIEADIILWHPYDRWGFSEMSDPEDDRYLRYCIARLSAYRNVWWSLANEYDFMTDKRPGSHGGNKQWEDWDRFFSILQKEDPHHRLRSIHNGSKWYDHTKEWVTHASVQSSDMKGGQAYRERYQKPVIYDECRYEGDLKDTWGNLTAPEMVQRFWLGTLSGCYVGHGETYKHPQDILWWSKGGVLHGQSPKRIAWLKDFMAKAPAFHELRPMGDGKDRFLLAKPGEYYLLYCSGPGNRTLTLAGDGPYKLDAVDPWEMTVTPVGTAKAGEFTVSSPKRELAFRFTPYGPGEQMRPEAKLTASVTEGVPPLKVQFAGSGVGTMRWDFGDGTTSDESNPVHVYEMPGLYSVTLAVTDAKAGSGRSFAQIAVDRKSDEPIVRAGVAAGETPPLTLHGTARRGDGGSLVLPDGAPWGWVRVGDRPLDDLRGLRSFTIIGCISPESLRVGSGGNRLVFCLNGDRDGIDLVCQADGRLRLAVNQWPDSVQNDSSPGKLQVGKWTCFAVTYDASKPDANVGWYFSRPVDDPASATVTLDRRTTYRPGPVGSNVGPLVLGNFNETMRGSGLDRQFRGAIRNVQIFGSRVGGGGALGAEAINAHLKLSPPAAGDAQPQAAIARPRVVVLSDFPPLDVIPVGADQGPAEKRSDPDDVQSMVRFLLYANDFDVEGLVASAATLANVAKKQNVLDILDLYDQVDENLRRHDPRYPTAEKLRSMTWQGRSGTYGKPADQIVGEGKNSEASEAIIKLVDRPDPRPLWFCVWGGSADLAQAIWKVRATRSPAELDQFLGKVRIYAIAKQDGSTQWLLDSFPGLFIILSERNYMGMFWNMNGSDPKLADLAWADQHIRKGHGALGSIYPESGANPQTPGVIEGDSPSFLHLAGAVRGLNGPEQPDQAGWGGRFIRRDPSRNHWFDDLAGAETVWRWRAEVQQDFARRADWMQDP
jgi:PKD repeat protein